MKPYWQSDDGKAVIYQADCGEVLSSLEGIDSVITDPPYGEADTHDGHLGKVMLKNGKAAGKSLVFAGITESDCVEMADRWVNLASGWVVFTCEWKFMKALSDAEILVRFGIWRKPDGAPQFTGDRPGTGWEAVAICHRPGKKRWNGGGKHAFWSFPKGQNDSGHPTGKPLGLFQSFVIDFTNPGETVLDPYMGSGTTGMACMRTGRRFIGIELNEEYCEMAVKRIRNAKRDEDEGMMSRFLPKKKQDKGFCY